MFKSKNSFLNLPRKKPLSVGRGNLEKLNLRSWLLKDIAEVSFVRGFNQEKGAIAILVTVLILSVILLIGVAVSAVFVGEVKVSSLVRQSGPAFYAAESGMEYAVYQIKQAQENGSITEGSAKILPTSGARFWVEWGATTSCEPSGYSICSTGKHQNARRRVNIKW